MTTRLDEQIAAFERLMNQYPVPPSERAPLSDALANLMRLNSPVVDDFLDAVANESTHQIARWGEGHDADKVAEDWYWLVGMLAGKALRAHILGDRGVALHHTISTAAVLFHWHRAITESGRGLGVAG